jgi:hypothetical protein
MMRNTGGEDDSMSGEVLQVRGRQDPCETQQRGTQCALAAA